ncbi:MAG TPA: isochorismatase family protein [Chloroflexota bacterium]|jgi:nicotinamidase-related amidase|nr:isochorismatase family protein [Chloroflexota bacterium]
MEDASRLPVRLRRQELVQNAAGYTVWQVQEERRALDARKTALLLCDVWDRHTCRGAEERLERLLPRMQQVVTAMRKRGVLIVHAPSDTMSFYEGTPARRRVFDCPQVEPPPDAAHDDPPLPVDQSDPCDTCPDEQHPRYERGMPYPWTRQHPAIEIDHGQDVVSCQGKELWSYYRHRGIEQVLIMGVHTGMCILNRTFSIKQMTRWGMPIALIRDLTDAMYNPSKPPYVSHEEGTRLIVEYIEKFWCPTLTSDDLVLGGGAP